MARRRGFLAEMNHQVQQAEKRKRQQEQAAFRAQVAAQKEAERAAKDAERAAQQAQRLSAAEQKAAEKEALRLHREARQAEVAALNAQLAATYGELDSMLAATLDVDDWVDLEQLREVAQHPPFQPPDDIARPGAPPPPVMLPSEPHYEAPPEPTGLSAKFGGRKRHDEAVAAAQERYSLAHQSWQREVARLQTWHQQQVALFQQNEQHRAAALEAARQVYAQECAQRDQKVAERNAHLDRLINELAFDVPTAIEEYVGIVLSNSVYPEAFPVEFDYTFDLGLRELTVTALVSPPEQLPTVREYKYVQARDEVTETSLPQKELKERYANVLAQVAVRTLHEVFEADRVGRVRSIALTVAVERIDPGTGLPATVPLAAVAVDRERFTTFNLAQVVPSATLASLGAQVSKQPYDLQPIDTSKGVRGR